MEYLNYLDLQLIKRRIPKNLSDIMEKPEWFGKIFIAGGFIRAIIAGERVNDIDIFVSSERDADILKSLLERKERNIIVTPNAITIKHRITIQIITRWIFETPEQVKNSFDFTICCAVIWVEKTKESFVYKSLCDKKFYIDLASKRLIYRKPIRNEDAGGSILRVLKYYQRGYRIPLTSLSDVIARLMRGFDTRKGNINDEEYVSRVVKGLLFEVDPKRFC